MVKILVLLLAAAAPARAELTQIGAAAAVSGMVKAMSQGEAVGRVVQSGRPLYLNDHVTTDDKGRLQVLLADETVFTLGPNSDMVLDEFVYDPASGAGKVSAKIVKGAFRFVTGKVARKDPEKMKVKLSVGTIGIRGTTVVGSVDPVAHIDTVVLMDNGMAVVQNDNGSVWLRAPGFGTVMTGPNAPPPPPQPMGQTAAQIMGQLNAPPPPQGGAGLTPPPGPGQASGGQGQEGQGQSPAGTGQFSAEEQSGLNSANLYDSAQTTQLIAGLSSTASGDTTQTVQDAVTEPLVTQNYTSWDDIRNTYSALGTLIYSGDGTYSALINSVADSGTMNFTLEVNFMGYTIGGGSSGITLNPATLNQSFNPFTAIGTYSFESLTGSDLAKIVLSSSIDTNFDPNFNNSTIAFDKNSGADKPSVIFNLAYDNGDATTATGTLTTNTATVP